MGINNKFVSTYACTYVKKTVFLAAISDYVNMTLPHVNSDYPIGFLVQFNMYFFIGLKTALLYIKTIISSCRAYSAVILKLINGARMASTGFRKYRVKWSRNRKTPADIPKTSGWSPATGLLPSSTCMGDVTCLNKFLIKHLFSSRVFYRPTLSSM